MAEDNIETLRILSATPGTIVKYGGNEFFEWLRGDIPICGGSNIRTILLTLSADGRIYIPERSVKRPDFEAVQFRRILHVWGYCRMTVSRTQLMEPRARDELNSELIDLLTDCIPPLFNNNWFELQPENISAGGVTKSIIISINVVL